MAKGKGGGGGGKGADKKIEGGGVAGVGLPDGKFSEGKPVASSGKKGGKKGGKK